MSEEDGVREGERQSHFIGRRGKIDREETRLSINGIEDAGIERPLGLRRSAACELPATCERGNGHGQRACAASRSSTLNFYGRGGEVRVCGC